MTDNTAREAKPGDRFCNDCTAPNPIWYADSRLWNRVMGGPDATDDPGGVVCPNCFIERADAKLGAAFWKLVQDPPRVAALQRQSRDNDAKAAMWSELMHLLSFSYKPEPGDEGWTQAVTDIRTDIARITAKHLTQEHS